MRKPSCSIFFCSIFLAQFSMCRKWFGVCETAVSRTRFSHTCRFLPPELEWHFTPVLHSSLPLFPTFHLVWCYLPRVSVREWGRRCGQTPSCWNTEQIAASEGLLCYNDPLYQTGRDRGWKKALKWQTGCNPFQIICKTGWTGPPQSVQRNPPRWPAICKQK